MRRMRFKAHTSVCLPLLPVVWRVGVPVSTAAPLHSCQRDGPAPHSVQSCGPPCLSCVGVRKVHV